MSTSSDTQYKNPRNEALYRQQITFETSITKLSKGFIHLPHNTVDSVRRFVNSNEMI